MTKLGRLACLAMLIASCDGSHTAGCDADGDCPRPEVCDLGAHRCTLDCRTGPRVALLVPRVRVHLVVTLAGGPPPTLPNFAVVGGPQLELVPMGEVHGPLVDLYEQARPSHDGEVPSSNDIDLVPGEYDARYRYVATAPQAGWPAETDAVVAHLSVSANDQTFAIDIAPVQLDIDTTLGGAPLPADVPDNDYVLLALRGAHGGQTGVRLCEPSSSGPTTCSSHTSVRVLPDAYDVQYVSQPGISPGPTWPAENGVVASAVDVTTDRTVQVDIPVVHVTLALMHAGAPLDRSALGTRDVYLAPGSNFGVPVGQPMAVLPGPHDVRLDAHWPALGGVLGHFVFGPGGVDEGGTANVDVDLVTVALDLTANGAPPPAGCSIGYHVDDWSDGDATSLSLVRGTHRISIEHVDCPGPWPQAALVSDALVVDADGPIALDVATVHLGLDLVYAGGALPPRRDPALLIVAPSGDDTTPDGSLVSLYADASTPPPAHLDLWMRPGVYDISILGDIASAGMNFPNGPAVVRAALVVDHDQSITLDLASVQTSIRASIDGGDPMPGDTTPSTEARIELVSRPPSVGFPLPSPHAALTASLLAPTFVAGPVTAPLPGGTYDVRYVGTSWRGMPGGTASLGCWTVSE